MPALAGHFQIETGIVQSLQMPVFERDFILPTSDFILPMPDFRGHKN